jgi:Tfp pilus assembly protein PilX
MSVYRTVQLHHPRGWSFVTRSDEQGMAMLTVVMVMLMLTVLGIAALTVSGLENNMAGLHRTMEASANAAESCLGTGANIIQQVFVPESGGQVPVVLLDNNSPPGPVPSGNQAVLQNELIGNPENLTDVPTGTGAAPNLVMPGGIGPYAVAGDIDRLYVKMRAGSGQQQFSAYEGTGVGAGSNGVDVYFRISCVATNTATGTESRVAAIYACSLTGDGCQKQP